MTQYVIDMFSFTGTHVRVTEEIQADLISPNIKDDFNDLSKMVNHLGWNDLFLISIHLKNDEFPYHTYDEYSVKKFAEQQKCLQLHHYVLSNTSELDEIGMFNSTWLKGHDNPAIIIFARKEETSKIMYTLKDLVDQNRALLLVHDVHIAYREIYRVMETHFFTASIATIEGRKKAGTYF